MCRPPPRASGDHWGLARLAHLRVVLIPAVAGEDGGASRVGAGSMTATGQDRRGSRQRRWTRALLGFVVVAPAAAIAVYAHLRGPTDTGSSSEHVGSTEPSTESSPKPSSEAPGEQATLRGSAPGTTTETERAAVEPIPWAVPVDEECATACRELGNCALEDGVCVPTLEEHCKGNEACHDSGMCRLLADDLGKRCGIESHGDCAETALCRDQQRCRFAPTGFGGEGRCVEVELVRSQRFPLTTKRHGIQGELLLFLDPALAKRPKKGAVGYWPDPEVPRAGAALTLRDRQGAVVDEVTLFPDVTVKLEDLGAGTDTFLATEHLACPAERHWCGPRTVFLEVRGGRLSRLSAIGPRGEERAMVAVDSGGARWKLERSRRFKTRDLLVQVESFVPPGPALLETRFTFSRGRFRFSERKWPEFLPKNVKLPGPWQGELALHAESRR